MTIFSHSERAPVAPMDPTSSLSTRMVVSMVRVLVIRSAAASLPITPRLDVSTSETSDSVLLMNSRMRRDCSSSAARDRGACTGLDVALDLDVSADGVCGLSLYAVLMLPSYSLR